MNKIIIELIYENIETINQDLPEELKLEKSIETAFLGEGSKLDSLGLINLIVAVEQNVEDKFGKTITLADEKAISQEISPFKTVISLANYIEMLLKEKDNEW